MKRNIAMIWINGLLALTVLAMAALVTSCGPTNVGNPSVVAASEPTQTASTRVVGFGEALGQPDEAQLTVGVETFAPKVDEATAENEEIIAAILGALEEAGIASEDVQTSNYSLWAEQKYGDNGPEGIAGYRVSNQVNVMIRDIDGLSDVLAAVTAAGANSIYGVQFSVADPAGLEAEAREKALEDARQRAESLARLSGLSLGSIVAIDETMGQFPSPAGDIVDGGRSGGAVDEASTSIAPGQLSYRSQVQVTFEIAE